MPVHSIVRAEFAEAVAEALGGLNANQASYRTGISDEYIRKMLHGRVPSEAIVERFAKGLDADLQKLRIAAGYETPADVIERVEIALRGEQRLSDTAKAQVLSFLQDVLEGRAEDRRVERGDAGQVGSAT